MNNVSDDAQGVKHTPGPWIIEDDSEGVVWVASENPPPREQFWTTAKCTGPNAHANARLIAAAPDLLAALKGAADDIERTASTAQDFVYVHTLRKTIAKAEGR